MDGIRNLASRPEFRPGILDPRRGRTSKPEPKKFLVLRALAGNTGQHRVESLQVPAAKLSDAFAENIGSKGKEDAEGGVAESRPAVTTVAYLDCLADGLFMMPQSTLAELLDSLQVDAWARQYLVDWADGYHHHRYDYDAPETHYLGTRYYQVVWTDASEKEGEAGRHRTVRVLVFAKVDDNATRAMLSSYLDAFHESSRTPFAFPLMLAYMLLAVEEASIRQSLISIQQIERRTGHGLDPSLSFQVTHSQIIRFTAKMASVSITIRDDLRHILSSRAICDAFRDKCALGSTKYEKSVADALHVIDQKFYWLERLCNDVENRAKSQSSVLFSFLTHEDSKVNLQVANANRDIARATQVDSSSMKTVAILTMTFLPATYFAALFSVPSLGWQGHGQFWIYWAFTIPATALTFGVWSLWTSGKGAAWWGRVAHSVRRTTDYGSRWDRWERSVYEFPEIPGEMQRNMRLGRTQDLWEKDVEDAARPPSQPIVSTDEGDPAGSGDETRRRTSNSARATPMVPISNTSPAPSVARNLSSGSVP